MININGYQVEIQTKAGIKNGYFYPKEMMTRKWIVYINGKALLNKNGKLRRFETSTAALKAATMYTNSQEQTQC